MTRTILRIESSARHDGSVTRTLTDRIIETLSADTVITRDLSDGMPLLTEAWVGANFTPEADRSDAQRSELATSDALIAELKAADTLVIGAPIYNFGVPAALKAWIDQIARAGVTFKYTENGPVGLLEGKRAIVVVASGGVPVDSDYDFVTGYLRHVLGFIGIQDVEIIAAGQMMMDADGTLANANAQVDALRAA